MLLGINCGFYATDLCDFHISFLDIHTGLADFFREKTGADRLNWFWPETREAVQSIVDNDGRITNLEPKIINRRFRDLLKRIGLHTSRRGFSSFRHTFRTALAGFPDREAVDLAMGHVPKTVGDEFYVHTIEPARAEAVSEHMRTWLWADKI